VIRMRADLHVHLDAPLPDTLAVGGGSALFVAGWCVAARARARVASLAFVVDGAEQPVAAAGMPRLDVLRALHPESAEEAAGGYRSGFWGLVRLPAGAGPVVVVELEARLVGGGAVRAELARIPVEELSAAAPAPGVALAGGDGPLVAICMATYDPPPDLLRRMSCPSRSRRGSGCSPDNRTTACCSR